MILEIGEVGVVKGTNVKCHKSDGFGCKKCAFSNDKFNCHGGSKDRPACFATDRPDNESVYYTPTK